MSTQIHPITVTVDGLSVRYAKGGNGAERAMLLCPWPECIFAYEPAWLRLAETAQLFAIDLPGFGGSERREVLMKLREIEVSVRIVQGSQDQVVPAVNATHLGGRLPNSQVDFIESARHFCWEERPEDYARLVTDWWKRDPAAS